jgi:prepilin-type N-terminal cleavage/methylation domain-containing protein
MRKKNGSSLRDPRWERGFTLIELLVVVGIVAVLLIAAGAFALGQRNYEIKAAGDRFDSLVDAARAIARSSGNGATLTVVKGGGGSGFVARVLSGRPNDLLAMKYSAIPALESNASIKETSDLNTEPPFAIFVNSRGNMSAASGWIFPDSGTIAQEPTCTAAIAIQFYENGQKLQKGIAGASRGFACAGYAAVNVPIVGIVTPAPYSTPTPPPSIDVRGTAMPCPPNALCCSTGQCTPTPAPTASPTPAETPTPTPTTTGVTPSPSPTGSGYPTPTPTPSPSPTGSGSPSPTPTGSGTPTPTPTGGAYAWELVGPPIAGQNQIGANGDPPPDPQCPGGQSFSPCFNGTQLVCPDGMTTFICMDALNAAIEGTSAFANGGVCNPEPGLATPVICWSRGRVGNRTPPPPPVPVKLDATSQDGAIWRLCYVGAIAPPLNAINYAAYALPIGVPYLLVQMRNAGEDPIHASPYGCSHGET